MTLISKWEKAMQKGLFNYDLGHIKSKHIEGPHKYVALVSLPPYYAYCCRVL